MSLPPELPDDLVGDTLLRLPPDDPGCLLRASLVCKRWRRIVADPAFRRRHSALYRTPHVLGSLHIVDGQLPFASRFVPSNPASGCPAARELPGWLPLDCRHGRALFLTPSPGPGIEMNYDFVVWDPLTNEQRHLPRPSPPPTNYACNAAVLCAAAAEGCNHRSCHKGAFLVAFIWSKITRGRPRNTSARVFSSVTGDWSELISVEHPDAALSIMPCPSTLVGDKLYFNCFWSYIFEYALGAQRLSIIKQAPPSVHRNLYFSLMSMEDGVLGCVDVEEEPKLCLRLWLRVSTPKGDGVACWEQGKAIKLETLLPDGAILARQLASSPWNVSSASVLCCADGTDAVFLSIKTHNHLRAVYRVELSSGRIKKVFEKSLIVVPYTSFCIPVIDSASTDDKVVVSNA